MISVLFEVVLRPLLTFSILNFPQEILPLLMLLQQTLKLPLYSKILIPTVLFFSIKLCAYGWSQDAAGNYSDERVQLKTPFLNFYLCEKHRAIHVLMYWRWSCVFPTCSFFSSLLMISCELHSWSPLDNHDTGLWLTTVTKKCFTIQNHIFQVRTENLTWGNCVPGSHTHGKPWADHLLGRENIYHICPLVATFVLASFWYNGLAFLKVLETQGRSWWGCFMVRVVWIKINLGDYKIEYT